MSFVVGQQVEVKYRTISAASKLPGFENIITVKGTVMLRPKWLQANEIAIATGNPEFPMSVLRAEQIVGHKQSVQKSVRSFKVKSKDKVYSVIYNNGNFTCSCTGFSFRKTCKHVVAVSQQISKKGG